MAEITPAVPGADPPARWKWYLALGALLLLLGLAAAGASTTLEITSLVFFGPMLLAGAIGQVWVACSEKEKTERNLHLAAVGPELFLGCFVMISPLFGGASLVAWAVILLFAIGLVRLVRSLGLRARVRSWAATAGTTALLLGIVVWAVWPASELWIVGLCLAMDFICHGATWSALALAERGFPEPAKEAL
jgi:uncharacterized membrane protein HdeD (DUF308 family)